MSSSFLSCPFNIKYKNLMILKQITTNQMYHFMRLSLFSLPDMDSNFLSINENFFIFSDEANVVELILWNNKNFYNFWVNIVFKCMLRSSNSNFRKFFIRLYTFVCMDIFIFRFHDNHYYYYYYCKNKNKCVKIMPLILVLLCFMIKKKTKSNLWFIYSFE